MRNTLSAKGRTLLNEGGHSFGVRPVLVGDDGSPLGPTQYGVCVRLDRMHMGRAKSTVQVTRELPFNIAGWFDA